MAAFWEDFLVAGPGFAPGFRDYEPRVVTTPPPRGVIFYY